VKILSLLLTGLLLIVLDLLFRSIIPFYLDDFRCDSYCRPNFRPIDILMAAKDVVGTVI
jgi:hypothetical protein